jgi:hypothetical protein
MKSRLSYLSVSFFFVCINCIPQGFQEIATTLPDVSYGEVAWGDYDNDGDLDILLTGRDQSYNNISRVYQNNGGGNFSHQTLISLTGVYRGTSDWVDYDNDGDLDIMISGSISIYSFTTKLYRNDGGNTFIEQNSILLPAISRSSVSWGDYNNDGDPDILITGQDESSKSIAGIYRNNGNNTFTEQTGISLTPVTEGNVTWCDFNNDKYLDILLSGSLSSTSSTKVTKIYINNGDNTFIELTGILLPGVSNSSVHNSDYDSDGDQDILLSGYSISGPISKVFKNNGSGSFNELTNISLTGISDGTAVWGDYDNDGDPDILIAGLVSKIYRNDGNDLFSEQTNITLQGLNYNSAAWADYDNDGDLDIFLTGSANSSPVTRLYKNNATNVNTNPSTPAGLTQTVSGNSVNFSWNRSTDNQTPQMGLTYNLYVSTSPSGCNIMAPEAFIPSGIRKITEYGSIENNQYTIRSLNAGTYYWSVQAIDAAYAGSAFPSEGSFTVSFSNSISPNEDQYVAPGKTGNPLTVNEFVPADSRQWKYSVFPGGPYEKVLAGEILLTYTPRITDDTIMYVVCVSVKNGISVISNEVRIEMFRFAEQIEISLPGISEGSTAWGDYDRDEDLDLLICGVDINSARVTKIFRNNGNNSFTEQIGINLPGVFNGSCDWVDYDNDGNLDIMITGLNINSQPISKLFKNNNNNTFAEQNGIIFPGVYYSATSWGDYDNDGDQDLLMTGLDQSSIRISKIYNNNGNNSFSEHTGINLPAVYRGDCSWADFDNDGDLDILISGNSASGSISKVFRNYGTSGFTEQTSIVLAGVYTSSVSWGDYDNDDYPDILLTGYNSSTGQRLSKVYRNNFSATSTFSEITLIQLTGVNNGSGEWGDFDNDGDLDILLSGYSATATAISEIYRNDGKNIFTKLKSNSFPGVYYSELTWADYDNDKDLDILISGFTGASRITKILRNIYDLPNSVPGLPSDLSVVKNGTSVTLSWNDAYDGENKSKGLSYNLRIGTSPGLSDIKSASSNSETGYNFLACHGNVGTVNSWTIKSLAPGAYYWSVQAIDHGFLASPFAAEKAFENSFTLSGYITGTGIPYFGDYDRDGDIDILIGNDTETTVYRNDISTGSGFTNINAGMPPTYAGDAAFAWGDYDNDGDLDIAYSGYWGLFVTRIYRNDNGVFTDINAAMQGVWMGTVAWGDYDNDGDLDLFVYGNHESSDDGEPIGILYRNDGNDTFNDSEIFVENARRGDVSLGDYNNDGYLDVLVCGYNLSANIFTSILMNNRNNTFTNINTGIPGYSYGDLCWGDYDSDGDLDIFITGGLYGGDGNSRIYENEGNGTFTLLELGGAANSAEWADYDNDGDLDILLSSRNVIMRNDGNGIFTTFDIGFNIYNATWADIDNDGDLDFASDACIFVNNSQIHNSPPEIPANLQANISGNMASLSWDKSTDATTPQGGITYNICIGTSPGIWNVLSPMVDNIIGYRKSITGMGNTMSNNFKIIENLPVGTYFWAVQSVDNGFMTSEFSSVKSFEILPIFTKILPDSYGEWGDYDNDTDLDIIQRDNPKMSVLRNDGSDAFVKNAVNINYTDRLCKWGDFDNDGDLDVLTRDSLFRNDQNNVFVNTGNYFYYLEKYVTGDYDADGDLDILGSTISNDAEVPVIYRNEKNNNFTKILLEIMILDPNSTFSPIIEGIDWFDYDNDGDLDIFLIYGGYMQQESHIFRNDGDDIFTDIHAPLTGLSSSSISYADYDNDYDLDILIGGVDNDYNLLTIIYSNDGNDQFSDINTTIRGYRNPKIFWGDHNNDGYIDAIISGYNNGRTRNKLYQNKRDGSFAEMSIDNIVEYINIQSTGDYDADGDLDAITSSGIFRNNTNPSNIAPQVLTNLNSDLKGLDCLLSWNRSGDAKGKGYSYNLRIGTTPGSCNIKSPKLPPGFGNVPCDTSWLIRGLAPGRYYWSVQAVNQTYSTGPWAPEKSFLITNVSPDFNASTVCFGSNTVFTDLSVTSDIIIKWKWYFGDGAISYQRNPVHRYGSSGTFNVSLWAYSQSGDSAERIRPVIVKPSPDAAFSVAPVCKDRPSQLFNLSVVKDITVNSWVWDFGNGESSTAQQSVEKIYVRSDTAILTIIAENGCMDADTQFVAIAEYPLANLSLLPGYSNVFCSGDSAILNVPYNDKYNYQWKLNGIDITGASGHLLNVKGPGGEYSVEVKNPVADCISSSSIQVILNKAPASPEIISSGDPGVLCEGDSILLSIPGSEGFTYEWKLNGGSVGSNSSQHFAKKSGKYTVIVSNSNGCSVSSTNEVTVVVNPLPVIGAISLDGKKKFCTGDSVTLSVPSATGYSYSWKDADGPISGAEKNSLTAIRSGKYQLEVSNTYGCKVTTEVVTVEVGQTPLKPAIDPGNYTEGKCIGETPVRLSIDSPVTGYTYLWYRNGTLIKTAPFIEGFLEKGQYYVEAQTGECTKASGSVNVGSEDAPPKPIINAKGPTVWYLVSSITNAAIYKWYYNGKLIPGAEEYLYVADQKLGKYNVSISNDKSCFTISDTITIPSGITGIEDTDPFTGLKIYPNPTTGLFTIEMDNNIFGELIIDIFTQNGSKTLNIKFEKTTEHFSSQIDMNGQSKGMYLINLSIDKFKATRKILVE